MKFDCLVIGAGSAGAPLAARLSEDPSRRVLLLEAGPDFRSAEAPDEMRGPGFQPIIDRGGYHWPDLQARLTEVKEPRLYLRGRTVGGSSSINAQGAVRGRPEAFDEWAALGCAGWSWEGVLPDFIALEDDELFGDRPYHGNEGPIPIWRNPRERWGVVSVALAEAATAMGHPWSEDGNAPEATGLSPTVANRRDNARVSTNDAYLEPARNRDNLVIQGETLVERIEFDGTKAVGAQVKTPEGSKLIEAAEIFVCAGAIHSPALLMRSGIGPAEALRALKIDVIADLPGVGSNLHDDPVAYLSIPIADEALSKVFSDAIGDVNLRYRSSIAESDHCDMDIFPINPFESPVADAEYSVHPKAPSGMEGGLLAMVGQPFSRGRVSLRSVDAAVDPTVEFRMLSDRRDIVRLRDGLRLAEQISRHEAFSFVAASPAVLGGTSTRPDELTDQELEDWLMRECIEGLHACGTCRMGDPEDQDTVVDPTCRVIGVDGLRVVDASVMPTLPRTVTHLTVVMIAEHLMRTDPTLGGKASAA